MAAAPPVDVASLYAAAKGAQIPRNGIIALLEDPNIGSILEGAFVRVLLELQDRREDYLLARIASVEHGEPYSGFSQQTTQTTTLLLRLQLPVHLAGVNGSLYQLLSISNSVMSDVEFERWITSTHNEFGIPLVEELQAISERIRPYTVRRGGAAQQLQNRGASSAHQHHSNAPLGVVPSAVAPQRSATTSSSSNPPPLPPPAPGTVESTTDSGSLGVAAAAPPVVPAASPTSDCSAENGGGLTLMGDIPTRQQITHQLLNELRDTNAVFAKNVSDLKVSQLRLVERDLIEYLENVRDAISSKRSTCVVCMDQVSSVVMLPCKHKVLCRLCAASVSSCPVCREIAVEMFEAVEI
mmetsp:Transcript_18649/g.21450  ORF Transcript_18649/g.21450 Transcript_18649/m.21450 type:complete len:354 (+) Transcript_18649:34-1095(+)